MKAQSTKRVGELSESKKIMVRIIDLIIFILTCITFYYVFLVNQELLLKILFGSVVCLIAIIYMLVKIVPNDRVNASPDATIQKMVLLSEKGARTKEWLIQGETSLVIGKNTKENEVAIDLSGTEYESLINYEHAVLNCVADAWFIEDIDSVNGVGIKKADKPVKSKLKQGIPCRINVGDTIYIGNTQILVR
ncbi:FHA domain-containing protein [Solibacillus sp. FSL K6-1523]|uniref:FHA domain-containing protein n=1 Tax=Solibacillus sp. FSL K6-1523 TaxID=2921471 RepID=UPI0030F8F345